MIEIRVAGHAEETLRDAWGDQLDRAALEGLVIESYRAARISAGEVAELLGLETSLAARTWLAEKGVSINYTDKDLEEDRHTIARHFAGFTP